MGSVAKRFPLDAERVEDAERSCLGRSGVPRRAGEREDDLRGGGRKRALERHGKRRLGDLEMGALDADAAAGEDDPAAPSRGDPPGRVGHARHRVEGPFPAPRGERPGVAFGA
jgi:hypothetical protein